MLSMSGRWVSGQIRNSNQLAPHVATLPEPKNSSVQPSGVVSVSQNPQIPCTPPAAECRFLGFRSQAGSVPGRVEGWRLGVFRIEGFEGGPST